MSRYHKELITPAARQAQQRHYGRSMQVLDDTEPDRLGDDEVEFIAGRDSFYLASVSPDGWPYIQHRGGPKGFLKVIDRGKLAFADLKGNRQLITTGNLANNDRVSLFLMDYPRKQRLKILGHATMLDAREHKELADQVAPAELRARVERVMTIEVVGFDWNCPAYITPRFSEAEIKQALANGWRPDA
jgi:predicted pyridoxine 5'-phosphate oxidase superfamily flavin-nucleotide-binding protein